MVYSVIANYLIDQNSAVVYFVIELVYQIVMALVAAKRLLASSSKWIHPGVSAKVRL